MHPQLQTGRLAQFYVVFDKQCREDYAEESSSAQSIR